MDIFELVIGTTFGTVSGFLVSLFLEKMKKPQIRMEVAEPELGTGSNAKYLWVNIKNMPLKGFMSFFTDRGTAYACKAFVSVYTFENHSFCFKMPGRWGETITPEYEEVKLESKIIGKIAPVPDSKALIITRGDGVQIRRRLINEQITYDIPAGSSTILDIVARQNNENECYGWNDENYLLDDKSIGIERRKLKPGQYIAVVRLEVGGHEFYETFKIRNDEPFEKFRLESYPKKKFPKKLLTQK